jgi:hypothetical protein
MSDQVKKDTGAPPLTETSYSEQYRRQRPDKPLPGAKRWQYVEALKREMPVLGGPNDQLGGNPDRYSGRGEA